jgi:hypothetical protein
MKRLSGHTKYGALDSAFATRIKLFTERTNSQRLLERENRVWRAMLVFFFWHGHDIARLFFLK